MPRTNEIESVEPQWRVLYLIGGVAALLTVVLGLAEVIL